MARGRTIQEVIDSGDTVMVYCHNWRCHHRAELDFLKLRAKLGPDHGAMHDDLVPKLVCSKCGGRDVGLTLLAKATKSRNGPPSTWGMMPPR